MPVDSARCRRWAVNAGLALAALGAPACSDSPTAPTIPGIPPDITGRITSIVPTGSFSGQVLVEALPGQPNVGRKGLVAINGSTVVFVLKSGDASGFDSNGEFRNLATGQWVRVWYAGPVMDSYPEQGTAATLVVDSLGVTVNQVGAGTSR